MRLYSILLFTFFTTALSAQKGYEIKVEIEDFKGEECYLAYHYGDKQLIKDTAEVKNETCIFRGEEPLPGGIYMIALPPSNTYFEIIIGNDQHFELETELKDLAGELDISGSKDNELFYEYISFLNNQKEEANALKAKLAEANNDAEKKEIQAELAALNNKVTNYQNEVINKHSALLYATILKALQEIEAPEAIKNDPQQSYYYLKAHYFDNIDFSDERLLRTPIYHNRLNTFFDKVVVRHPDSINAAADMVLEKARANDKVFQYTLIDLLNRAAESKIMGMDAVYVHLVENYYASGDAFWLDEAQKYRITARAKTLKPLLLGKASPPLALKDTSGKWQDLYKTDADYTIIYFWDPDCGHCKKVTPKLKEFYDENKNKGVEVFGVSITHEDDRWKEYIRKNNLNWINVADPQYQSHFRETFDISSTPQIYVLDKDKKIIAKKIGVEQLPEVMESFMQK